jgi:hypothetical protein
MLASSLCIAVIAMAGSPIKELLLLTCIPRWRIAIPLPAQKSPQQGFSPFDRFKARENLRLDLLGSLLDGCSYA